MPIEMTLEQREVLDAFRERYDTVMVRRGTGSGWDGTAWTATFCITGGTGDAEEMLEERAVLAFPGGGTREAALSADECLCCPGLLAEFGRLCETCYDRAQDS